jgi:8-oxo-dGTP pyrophosphatase MutT (NUDIX family)
MPGSNLTRVLAAVIRRNSSVLLAKRPRHKRHGGCWEFPGGKVDPAEDYLSAAYRELAEELALEVLAAGPVLFRSRDPGSNFLVEFVEVKVAGEPRNLEHDELAWVPLNDLPAYNLAPTDRAFANGVCAQRPSDDGTGGRRRVAGGRDRPASRRHGAIGLRSCSSGERSGR